ncbi:MAG TPA: thiamine-phosphate kinase [Bacteroidales bacterium]|nr:thiamine-phosphate kinase [Bacteroidales bacterium]
MKESKNVASIGSMGEFGLINHLTKNFKHVNKSTLTAVGDDAAVIECGADCMLVTTDLLVEGVHFDLMYTPLRHLGYKSVVVNLSDIYAMNGKPEQITVSIAISAKITLTALDELYAGIKAACERYGVDLIGGDTTTSITGMTISVTALGRVKRDEICYRSGAKINHLVCVTGNLGAAYLGLQLLEREKELYLKDPNTQPEISGYPYCIERILKPENTPAILQLLRENNILPSAMMDVSDGLSSDILHICSQSGVSCKIFEDKIPIHPETRLLAEEFHLDPSIAALNGGEDYELLFTADPVHYEKLSAIEGIHVIGYITDTANQPVLVARNGVEVALKAQGWNHFNK